MSDAYKAIADHNTKATAGGFSPISGSQIAKAINPASKLATKGQHTQPGIARATAYGFKP